MARFAQLLLVTTLLTSMRGSGAAFVEQESAKSLAFMWITKRIRTDSPAETALPKGANQSYLDNIRDWKVKNPLWKVYLWVDSTGITEDAFTTLTDEMEHENVRVRDLNQLPDYCSVRTSIVEHQNRSAEPEAADCRWLYLLCDIARIYVTNHLLKVDDMSMYMDIDFDSFDIEQWLQREFLLVTEITFFPPWGTYRPFDDGNPFFAARDTPPYGLILKKKNADTLSRFHFGFASNHKLAKDSEKDAEFLEVALRPLWDESDLGLQCDGERIIFTSSGRRLENNLYVFTKGSHHILGRLMAEAGIRLAKRIKESPHPLGEQMIYLLLGEVILEDYGLDTTFSDYAKSFVPGGSRLRIVEDDHVDVPLLIAPANKPRVPQWDLDPPL